MGGSAEFSAEQQAALEKVVRDRKGAFAYSMKELPGYHGDMGAFKIELTTDRPIFAKPRRNSLLEREAADKKCYEMLEADIIGPCPDG